MKYLCLAYGSEEDWNRLTKNEQDILLTQDEVIRDRGALMAAVETNVTTVTAWDGTPKIEKRTFSDLKLPLAGFSVIDAENIDEVIDLIKDTPCARAKGAIEIRPIMFSNL
jgi:hypothetical protein